MTLQTPLDEVLNDSPQFSIPPSKGWQSGSVRSMETTKNSNESIDNEFFGNNAVARTGTIVELSSARDDSPLSSNVACRVCYANGGKDQRKVIMSVRCMIAFGLLSMIAALLVLFLEIPRFRRHSPSAIATLYNESMSSELSFIGSAAGPKDQFSVPSKVATQSPSRSPFKQASPILRPFSRTNPTSTPSLSSGAITKPPTFRQRISNIPTLDHMPQDVDTNSCPSYPSVPPLPGKKGVGLTLRAEGKVGSWVENIPKLLSLDPYWNYSWGAQRVAAQPDDIEFVPMVFGAVRQMAQNIQDYIVDGVESGIVRRVLAYNEPDSEKQSNLSVETALDKWPLLEELDVPLISPSAKAPLGPWMETFVQEATSRCSRIDWVGVHWYGSPDLKKFQKTMSSIHKEYKKPLLITEFAPVDRVYRETGIPQFTDADVLNFMKAALPWLEKKNWIAGYAWFPFTTLSDVHARASALFDENDNLTTLGKFYASVRTENPTGNVSIGVL